ncbi:MAG: dTDP-glucose 4,6-dehydratase [Planctomycetota bacterium]
MSPLTGTLLVTGGCGFIGSNFIRLALAGNPGLRVINLDALTYAGNPENLADLERDSRYSFLRADIADPAAVEDAFSPRDCGAVVNFAAESHVDRSILSAADFIRTNVLGTQVLLEAARARRVPLFLQVSTDEVYGALALDAPTGAFTEDSSLAPNSPYSASKAAADLLVRAAWKTHRLPAVITRSSNNYGPWQFPEKLIPLFITNALDDKPLPVYGDGLYVRDWIHVSDHCRALLAVLERPWPGAVYNIGARNELPNIDITRLILDILEKPHSLVRHVEDRPGHDRRYAIDPSRIEKDLGWKPRIPFQEGLRQTVQWYLDHKSWWQRVKSGEYLHYYETQYGKRLGT